MMADVTMLDGSRVPAHRLLERLEAARLRLDKPFAPDRLARISGVAETILRGGFSPATKHFAFWTRRAALERLARDTLGRLPPKTQARPRGLVFHLPPQNVETVFLYSWVLAYLVGSANAVRLPAVLGEEMRRVTERLAAALSEGCDENGENQLFFHYPPDSDLGAQISALADARLVWGGSAKVAAFSALPLRDGGKSLHFGDRVSLAVLNGAALAELDAKQRMDLAARLYNDVYIFDQMACASPQVVYVVGARADVERPARALLADLAAHASAQGYPLPAGHGIAKLVASFASAAAGEADHVRWAQPELVTVTDPDPEWRTQRIGGGYLRLAFLPELSALARVVQPDHQTVTHFGFTEAEVAEGAASLGPFGVSRWAGVGSALDFDAVWDGYDVPSELMRLVRLS